MTGKGWYGNKMGHSLASRGIKSSDRNHLNFIYQRMKNNHGENPDSDYMIKLKEIINLAKGTDTNVYLIEYNDIYGNGEDKYIEGYIENINEFDEWLSEHNKTRIDDGNDPENAEEFNIITIHKLADG